MAKDQKQAPKEMKPPMVEKPLEFKKTLKRLASYLKPERKKLIAVAIFAVLSTIFNVLSPIILGTATTSIFDSVTTGTAVDFGFIGQVVMTLVLLYLLASSFAFLQQSLMAGVSQRTIATLRKQVTDKLTRVPLKYYDQNSHGDLLSRAVNDIDNINNSLQQGLSQIITSVFTVLGIIVMMLFISPLLTLVICITIPLSLISVRTIASYSQNYFRNQQNEVGQINGHVEEMYGGHHVVKAFGYEKTSIERFDEVNERLYKAGSRAQFISGIMMPVMMFIGNLGFVFVSIVGGVLVINGSIVIGNVQAFIQYTQQISQPMNQIASIANMIQNALASAERVFILLDEAEEKREERLPVNLDEVKGNVSFEHVGFGYEENEDIINDLNIEVNQGQMVAIVGPTGAGKTTLINLLMRFYEINRGKLRIGEVNSIDLSREQVRSIFAMVLQDTWLFSGTIRENIAYGKKNATEEEVIAAARAAYADDFIRTLPNGYDTVLENDASNISQGQRQLLTIARAIISDPKILILDEATSSVDTRTELQIQKAMKQMMKNRTSFVIAHRLSTIKDSDVILVMNKGDIIEKGNHRELLEQKGFYADLYESQFAQ
ncbi:ABC transporter ATP-binding protein [Evansella cellulosilytica]|uniref:ABC transporter related protein n=1 Tax=Evansella cellulosilytica (strain ATCC 21833 / DSM 2522 / FERM P-1141 / JCM 9156 / N-4) TaxID=649639 RepID=E6TSQ9_EVAC2|nr:ABC transporter ATP-binding protein [Evansella cellulosilytica]ADU29567.1 ABC transporter related protein [Evansella cellulosilytica DSM 2522]